MKARTALQHFTLPSNSTVLQSLPFSSVISLIDSKQNLNRTAVIPHLKFKLNKNIFLLSQHKEKKTPTCSGSELFQCNKQQALVEIYCKIILQVCFHSLYIINLHENGTNPSKGFKLLWDQNNVASYNLKQHCTSNHWVLSLSDFRETSFKFLLCLLTRGERTIWSWLWSLHC